MIMQPIWTYCFTCRDYADKRRDVIAEPLAEKAHREDRDVVEVVNEFMNAAHARHIESGEPLLPGGPSDVFNPAVRRLSTMLLAGTISHDEYNKEVGIT